MASGDSNSDSIQAKCLCTETTISIANVSKIQGQALCHCSDCQHTSGTPCSWNVMVAIDDLKVDGPITKYESKVPSGNTVTRAFCSKCGSPVYHHSPAFGKNNAVQTGHFKYFADKPVGLELWAKDRWAVLPVFEGAQVKDLQ